MKRQLLTLGLAAMLAVCPAGNAWAQPSNSGTTIMENCGAYLFEWRPIDCGNGQAFAILVGQNTLNESDVILNRGYDYAYSLYSMQYSRPWGTVPDLVNIDGVWGIPENWANLPAGSQPTLRITLLTNNKNMDTNERYIDVVHLPNGVDPNTLPAEVRKYLINTDGSDAGAYNGTITPGWQDTAEGRKYLKPDGTYVTNGWLRVNDEYYYMDANGLMLKDTVTPDGVYVNSSGERQGYMPGWYLDPTDNVWRYVQKNGYYMSNGWLQDTDGKWYYFNLAAYMETDTTTPDGYYVGADGAWDRNPSAASAEAVNLGPGAVQNTSSSSQGWEQVDEGWRYHQTDGTYAANGWLQTPDGKWYYVGGNGLTLATTTTPDGYHVGADGAWDGNPAAEA